MVFFDAFWIFPIVIVTNRAQGLLIVHNPKICNPTLVGPTYLGIDFLAWDKYQGWNPISSTNFDYYLTLRYLSYRNLLGWDPEFQDFPVQRCIA